MKVFQCIPFHWIRSKFTLRIACSHRYKVNNTYIQFLYYLCRPFSHRRRFSSLTQNLLHNLHAKLNFTNSHKASVATNKYYVWNLECLKYRLDHRRSVNRFPAEARDSSLLQSVQTGFWGPTSPVLNRYLVQGVQG
jgi:hypothetical protein